MGTGVTYTVIAPGPPHAWGPPAHDVGMAPPMGGVGAAPAMRGGGMAPRPIPGHGRAPSPRPVIDQQVVRVLYAALGLIGVGLGVSLPGATGIGWSAYTAWSIFAVVCALAVLGAAALESASASWPLAQLSAGGLLVFWLIAVRPIAISDVGFLATLGVAGAIAAVLMSPRRSWRFTGIRSPR